jgi:hypothetical protein
VQHHGRVCAETCARRRAGRPGESYQTTLVFDLPEGVQNPRLLLTDPWPVNRLLIGHENSFFHKKVYFRLDPAPAPGATARAF